MSVIEEGAYAKCLPPMGINRSVVSFVYSAIQLPHWEYQEFDNFSSKISSSPNFTAILPFPLRPPLFPWMQVMTPTAIYPA